MDCGEISAFVRLEPNLSPFRFALKIAFPWWHTISLIYFFVSFSLTSWLHQMRMSFSFLFVSLPQRRKFNWTKRYKGTWIYWFQIIIYLMYNASDIYNWNPYWPQHNSHSHRRDRGVVRRRNLRLFIISLKHHESRVTAQRS